MSPRPRILLLRLVFPSVCASLGTWQVFRLKQKSELLKTLELQQSSAPTPLISLSDVEAASAFQKYQIDGLKTTGKQVLLGPRGNSSIPGGYAYLLFELANLSNGQPVVLNRGWVPMDKKSQIDTLKAVMQQYLDSIVVVKDAEERKPLFGRSNTATQLLWKDWSALSRLFNVTAPLFAKIVVGGGGEEMMRSRDSVPIPHTLSTENIPNRHLEYICTWFSLSAISLLMSFLKK